MVAFLEHFVLAVSTFERSELSKSPTKTCLFLNVPSTAHAAFHTCQHHLRLGDCTTLGLPGGKGGKSTLWHVWGLLQGQL